MSGYVYRGPNNKPFKGELPDVKKPKLTINDIKEEDRPDISIEDLPEHLRIRWITADQIAVILDISRMSVYRLIEEGKIKAYRIGHLIKIKEEDFLFYLENAKMN